MKYTVKNWKNFQQYKDDRPLHWIKLHTKLINDFKFNQLSELSQLHLIKLWLLAAEKHGEIEGDEAWFARLLGAKRIHLDDLVRAGYLLRTKPYETVPREEKRREEKNIVELKPNGAEIVFEYWKEKLKHDKAVFDISRKRIINKALESHTVENLKLAIDGCSSDEWHMGKNDRGKVYDGVHVIFKDSDKIEGFINGRSVRVFGDGAL